MKVMHTEQNRKAADLWNKIYRSVEESKQYQFGVASNDSIMKVLLVTKELLKSDDHWTKNTYFKIIDNTPCYCLTGAVYMACYLSKAFIAEQVFQKLRDNIKDRKGSTPWSEVAAFNDFSERKYEDIIDLVDRTLASL